MSNSAMRATPSAASDAAMADPTPPVPEMRHDLPRTSSPLRFKPRANPAPSNISPTILPSSRTSTALHEPATLTAVDVSSSKPAVTTLCGMVTSAPRMFESFMSLPKNAG